MSQSSDWNRKLPFWRKIRQVVSSEGIRYLFFGGATTVVNWSIYTICVRIFGTSVFWAGLIAWGVAVLFAYVTNKILVFSSPCWKPSVVLFEFGIFVSARLLTGVLEVGLVPFLVTHGVDQMIFGIEGMVAKIIVSIVVVLLNYVFSKILIFRKNLKREGT